MAACFLEVAVPGPFPRGLTYRFEGEQDVSLIGRRVRVPLRNREVIGFVLNAVSQVEMDAAKLKSVIEVIDAASLIPANVRGMIEFMRDYYHVSLGDAYYTALPSLICAGKALTTRGISKQDPPKVKRDLSLNEAQQKVGDAIRPGFAVHLLEGVTGSGKTEVYLKCAERILARHQAVLVLVPEIGLTPQIFERFQAGLDETVATYHSGLTEAEKRTVWLQVLAGDVRMVIGTRSAVFLPFPDVGLIVIDEEHDASYKQQTGVHYSAKSIALMRGKQAECPVILGSATPSAEAYYFAGKGTYQHHHLKKRAIASAENGICLIDMRQYKSESGISPPLLAAMKKQIEAGNQVLIFLNRRGYAPVLLCSRCGERTTCQSCDMSFTLHETPRLLLCHHCGRSRRVPKNCTSCGSEFTTLGQGTQQLEAYLETKFPGVTLLRLDQDATRKKGELAAKLREIKEGAVQLIIGTQMIAKGHDFPNITCVGIVDLDYGFFAPDFRGIERMGQVLTQVAGRAGRGQKAGEVLIQTHVPDHPLLQCLLREGYAAFVQRLLLDRKAACWPPFQHLALLRAESKNEARLFAFLNEIKLHISQAFHLSVQGPVPAFLKKKKNYYRAQLILESPSRNVLHQALTQLETVKDAKNQVRFYVDVDPIEVG